MPFVKDRGEDGVAFGMEAEDLPFMSVDLTADDGDGLAFAFASIVYVVFEDAMTGDFNFLLFLYVEELAAELVEAEEGGESESDPAGEAFPRTEPESENRTQEDDPRADHVAGGNFDRHAVWEIEQEEEDDKKEGDDFD